MSLKILEKFYFIDIQEWFIYIYYRTCLNFLFLRENEVLLMTFEPKWTNHSSATKRIFGLKGRRMTYFVGKEISLNRFIICFWVLQKTIDCDSLN
jgi:hypothetical protein